MFAPTTQMGALLYLLEHKSSKIGKRYTTIAEGIHEYVTENSKSEYKGQHSRPIDDVLPNIFDIHNALESLVSLGILHPSDEVPYYRLVRPE